jgi:hypothetical protein
MFKVADHQGREYRTNTVIQNEHNRIIVGAVLPNGVKVAQLRYLFENFPQCVVINASNGLASPPFVFPHQE